MNINLSKVNDMRTCLKALIDLGLEAQRKLNDLEQCRFYTWDTIFDEFESRIPRPIPSVSRIDYQRWLSSISAWARENRYADPSTLTREAAFKAMTEIWQSKVSVMRIIGFFKRMWRTLGLDESIWHFSIPVHSSEFYRRLSQTEITHLHRYLQTTNSSLADMLTIGYYTGLRLSDIAELEISEVDLQGIALSIIPNKLKTRKPKTLRIPLVAPAAEIVRRRMHSPFNGKWLFDESCRRHTSGKFSKAFKTCKIFKAASGRASFHSIRATFISLMDDAQIQPYLTDAITGHANLTMHGRYSQPSLPALRKAIQKAIPRLL